MPCAGVSVIYRLEVVGHQQAVRPLPLLREAEHRRAGAVQEAPREEQRDRQAASLRLLAQQPVLPGRQRLECGPRGARRLGLHLQGRGHHLRVHHTCPAAHFGGHASPIEWCRVCRASGTRPNAGDDAAAHHRVTAAELVLEELGRLVPKGPVVLRVVHVPELQLPPASHCCQQRRGYLQAHVRFAPAGPALLITGLQPQRLEQQQRVQHAQRRPVRGRRRQRRGCRRPGFVGRTAGAQRPTGLLAEALPQHRATETVVQSALRRLNSDARSLQRVAIYAARLLRSVDHCQR
mmetsp:Transcript_42273/g.106881  ORF Transcript_42273/g.106881 Transcript_42273/m.106881 type:complete len:292 (-) Transcript_42273:19-894(-)